eukprot:TRINITY_DN66478_c7_g6_i1.p1 TRINITY_DN66478_c7_g6~~TRINITY_DN66478_c7_g6_i1.p1  ORF type:complete len:242 (-),score=20.17 TRINITY_DN66478_c7_g6_i1:689-1414(-)
MMSTLQLKSETTTTTTTLSAEEHSTLETATKKVKLYLPLIWWLDQFLNGLPANPQWVFRGMSISLPVSQYPTHGIAFWNQFSSCTLEPQVAVFFTRGNKGTIFVLHTENTKSINCFSEFPAEREVVLPSSTQFHVIGRLPQTHLRMISVKSNVYMMVENKNTQHSSENNRTELERLSVLLSSFRRVQFLYTSFLCLYIPPSASTVHGAKDVHPLLPQLLGDFYTEEGWWWIVCWNTVVHAT